MAEHPDAAKIRLVVYPGNEVVELRRNVWGCRTYICWGSCNYCHRQSRDMAMKETISTLLDEIKLLQEN
ncbi:MAG: hypothetical protein VB050_00425 [Geobacteraceae bacterium]|nr:hypothetical protein [Geobacteraceae bacterium]